VNLSNILTLGYTVFKEDKNLIIMDWTNIDLESGYEKSQNLMDGYTFEQLLLEIYCNLREENLTPEEIKKHTESVFKAKYEEAIEILNDNLINITNYAKNERI